MKKGMTINWNGEPHEVVATEHVKPGKGPAYVQAKLRRLKTAGIAENRFNASDKVLQMMVTREGYTYSYESGSALIFMHLETFDELPIQRDDLGDKVLLLKSGDEVEVEFCDGEPLRVKLPKTVVHEIADTPPALKGATATNQLKPATTETGLTLKVPPFIGIGERVRIDTDTGAYLERAKD
jgi:elongation factor P